MYDDSFTTMRNDEIEIKDNKKQAWEEFPYVFKDFKTKVPLNEE